MATKRKQENKNPVIRKNGKWYNTITGKYVKESTAKRYNSFYEKYPEAPHLFAYGEKTKYKLKRDVRTGKPVNIRRQSEVLQQLFEKDQQLVYSRNIKGKKIGYNPFEEKIVEQEILDKVKEFDYFNYDNKLRVHLYRLTKDGLFIYHIVNFRLRKYIRSELQLEPYIIHLKMNIFPMLKDELRKIHDEYPLGKYSKLFAHLSVSFIKEIPPESIPVAYITKGYSFSKQNIVYMFREIEHKIHEAFDRFQASGYHNLYIKQLTVFVRDYPNKETLKYARFRMGIYGQY